MKTLFSFKGLTPSRLRWAALALMALLLIGGLAIGAKALQNAKASDAPSPEQVAQLVQSCVVQMINETCRVTSGPKPEPRTERLFIAGVGEVDATAFAELQRFGDAMCQHAGAQCQADWDGPACRIAKALYQSAE